MPKPQPRRPSRPLELRGESTVVGSGEPGAIRLGSEAEARNTRRTALKGHR